MREHRFRLHRCLRQTGCWLLLVLLWACATAAPLAQLTWFDIPSTERAEALFAACGMEPRILRLENSQLRFFELAPRGTPWQQSSSEPPWLFVHGLGGNMGDFAPVIVEAGARHRVFAVDLPGFGGSISRQGDYSLPAFVRTLREFAAAVGNPRFHLVCHSLGGQICLGLALDSPPMVASLVLIDAAGAYDPASYVERMTHRAFGQVRGRQDPGMAAVLGGDLDILGRLIGNEPFLLAALGSFRSNYHNRVRDLQTPTLVIWGKDDPVFPLEDAFFIKENVAGARLRVVPDAGHTPQLSHPDLVLQWIQEFHAELLAGKSG